MMLYKLLNVRILFLIITLSILFAGFSFYKNRVKEAECKDCNLIIISVDTLRADHMGVYGYKKKTTPNIDKWAKSAIIFEKMYTLFPLTAHSFYTLFTGQKTVLENQNFQNSTPLFMNDKMSANTENLPKKLKENGYFNAAFITNPVIEYFFDNFKRNFDHFNFINTSKFTEINPAMYSYTYSDQKILTKNAIKFMQKNTDKKLFLWLHYLNPHHPYNAPWQYACGINSNFCNIEQKSILNPEDSRDTCLTKLTAKELEKEIALYDGEIKTTDEQIGQILAEIENLKLNHKTVVVFYVDHGEGFDHEMYHHGNALYESSVRIPFIVYIPGKSPQRIEGLLDNSDIMQGILDILGISQSKSLIKSLIDDPSKKGNPYTYFLTPINTTNRQGVTDGRYKYIETKSDYCLYNGYSQELYDLKTDPDEQKNIFKVFPGIAKELKNQIDLQFKIPVPSKTESSPNNTKEIINTLKDIGY